MKLLHESMQEPIRDVLDDSVSEEAVQRVWRGVRRRRSAPVRSGGRRYVLALASAALMAIVVLVFALRAPSGHGPLLEASGRTLNSLGATAASSTPLSDGSRIDLGPGAELEVLDNDESSFVCVLRRGRGTFEVKPGGPRRWRVEAGALRVEVIGTRFTVDRAKARVSVSVERGTVLVRGDRVPDGVQKLTAGSRLVIDVPEPLANVPSARAVQASTPAASPGLDSAGAANSNSAKKDNPAVAALPSSPARTATVDWLQVADEQRRNGNLKGAIASLRAAMNADGDGSRRAIAAFTLGKLLLDSAGRPADAAQAFRSCLRSSPPAAMAEDASARLVEAQARAGNGDAARRGAREYERRYPNGRRLADVRRWAGVD
jgi:transmembrane sensor